MARIILYVSIMVVLFSSVAFGRGVRVKGHFRKDDTYVQPHYRSAPNSTKSDNWSTKGNLIPYTGMAGTKSTDEGNPTTPNLGSLPSNSTYSNTAPSSQTRSTAERDCSSLSGTEYFSSCVRKRASVIHEIEQLRGRKHFDSAYADCESLRGAEYEASCIRKRINVIADVDSLKAQTNFNAAYSDCSTLRGTEYEATCIRKRLTVIDEILAMKSKPRFDSAYSDCTFLRGTEYEDTCIRKRMGVIEEIEALNSRSGFQDVYASCSSLRGTEYEASCIREKLGNKESGGKTTLTGFGDESPSQRSCCKVCTNGQACGNSCIS